MTLLQTPPLALYVHFPWCVRKCPYCDFNSHAIRGSVPEQRYVELLLRDFERQMAELGERPVTTVFLGGGTPSLFTPEAIDRLFAGLRRFAKFVPDVEVTLEANPGTIERGRFSEYRAAGVNRVSLGAQSFNARHLERLGRIHSAHDTRVAVAELASAGIENFNLDLMYGLPDQTPAEAIADLEGALALEPSHLSHYQLTLEPGTAFFHAPPALPADDETWQMQLESQARIAEHGFAQYEVSAYARPGRECQHNRNYWEFGDYLGIGAGAHGKLTDVRQGRIARTETGQPPSACDIGTADLPFEFALNGLRLKAGFSRALYESRTGLAVVTLAKAVARANNRGLLEQSGHEAWRCSELGYRFLNDLLQLFLAESRVDAADSYAQAQTMEPAAMRCD
jgi:oxygen-independent coproporphyrinogen-3 oxidase